ncbi:MAG: beta-ribofuranosylaminobenzene 5'-phosphate synthase [Candidatus Methanospirare jalkutatii]|nr:beta-ribofuranosylaminobenzene 5'-phosphate synthase [Candidatus Methanospirare jalkutatii]
MTLEEREESRAETRGNGVVKVRVKAPSRLHFSLIDLNGSLGRVDGGIGVALNEPYSEIEIESVGEGQVSSPPSPEVAQILERLKKLGLKRQYSVRILRRLPSHVGLGSKTQLALSIARGVAVLEGLDVSTRELARIVRRGGTSGIGVAAFEKGGFILDGGHKFAHSGVRMEPASDESVKTSFLPSSASRVPPPPVLFQHPLPEDWFFVLAMPEVRSGAHGAEEVEIFQKYCPIRGEEVAEICRIILMRILPAVLERDIETFASSLTMLQHLGFKRLEVALQHKIVRELFTFYEKHEALGYGMSSFGPTTFAVVQGRSEAEKLAEGVRGFLEEKGIRGAVCFSNANNLGAEVRVQKEH